MNTSSLKWLITNWSHMNSQRQVYIIILTLSKEKINDIKKSNQILLEKLLDISKGKRVSYDSYCLFFNFISIFLVWSKIRKYPYTYPLIKIFELSSKEKGSGEDRSWKLEDYGTYCELKSITIIQENVVGIFRYNQI